MKKLLTAALLLIATTANADLYGGAHYLQMGDSDITLGGAGVTLGYEHAFTPNTAGIIEVKAGLGAQDDTYNGVDVDLDGYRIISLKARQETKAGVYLLGILSHATIEVDANYQGYSASTTETEIGYGAGIGYDFERSQIDIELTYEKFDDVNVATINFKFDF